jgi:uncharacterized protein
MSDRDGSMGEPLSAVFDRIGQLLEFPVAFPMKVIGQRVDDFAQQIAAVVLSHVPDFDASSINLRVSSKGTYLSVTVEPVVHSKQQLEAVYRALSEHPLVRIVM